MTNEIEELKQEIQQLRKQQQTTNELLLATYVQLQEFMTFERANSRLQSEELSDYYSKQIIHDDTDKIVKDNIGGLYEDLPECHQCLAHRFMTPFEYNPIDGTETWMCSHCGADTTIPIRNRKSSDPTK